MLPSLLASFKCSYPILQAPIHRGAQGALDDMVGVPITEDAAYTLGTEHGQGID